MVYFILDPDKNAVKIGYASNVKTRLKALQTANPTKLQLIQTIDGSISTEQSLHKIYSAFHIHGEWFSNEGYLAIEILDRNLITERLKHFLTWESPGYFNSQKQMDKVEIMNLHKETYLGKICQNYRNPDVLYIDFVLCRFMYLYAKEWCDNEGWPETDMESLIELVCDKYKGIFSYKEEYDRILKLCLDFGYTFASKNLCMQFLQLRIKLKMPFPDLEWAFND